MFKVDMLMGPRCAIAMLLVKAQAKYALPMSKRIARRTTCTMQHTFRVCTSDSSHVANLIQMICLLLHRRYIQTTEAEPNRILAAKVL